MGEKGMVGRSDGFHDLPQSVDIALSRFHLAAQGDGLGWRRKSVGHEFVGKGLNLCISFYLNIWKGLWRIWGSIRRKSGVERRGMGIRLGHVSFLDLEWEVQWFAVSLRHGFYLG